MILILIGVIGVNRRQYRQTSNILPISLPISCLQVWQVSIPANIPLQRSQRRHIYQQLPVFPVNMSLIILIDCWLWLVSCLFIFQDICYQYPGKTTPTGPWWQPCPVLCWGFQSLIYNLLIWLSGILGSNIWWRFQSTIPTLKYSNSSQY